MNSLEINAKIINDEIITDDMFERVGTKGLSGETLNKPSLTYWADVWRRFKANKLAIVGLILLILVVLTIYIGPLLSGKDYQHMDSSVKA